MPLFGRCLTMLLLCATLGLVSGRAQACPNCKEAVAAQPSDVAAMAEGYNYSVLLMLAVPFTMLSTRTLVVIRAAKRGTLPEL
jgi:hypothetical protein